MLPREFRLSKDWILSKVRRQGRRAAGRFSMVFFLPNRSVSSSRASIIVSKKISKLAVERNLVKRRFSEALQKIRPRLIRGYYLVFSLSSRSRNVSFQDLSDDLSNLLNKARLLKSK